MAERVVIREYSFLDVEELIELWHETFSDDKSLIKHFFELLPNMGRGYVAVAGTRLLGMVFVLNFMAGGCKYGYIYALAVKEQYRGKGIGSLLMSHCGKIYPRLCTLPAESSLYAWYEERLGMKYRTRCRYDKFLPEDYEGTIRAISHTEYAARRGEFALETKHPMEWYEFQRELCRSYGGGMFAYGRSIACGYVENNVLVIIECLGSTDFIPMLCHQLKADYAEMRRFAFDGSDFICSNMPIPETLNFNLTLD